jgi:thiol-disulfide isomerase/thioredoxin
MQGNPPSPIAFEIEKPTLVHFWATWCAPCVEELPALVNASKNLRKSGFDVIVVSVDASASSKVPTFLAKHGLSGTTVYWDARSELYKRMSVQILPTTVLLAPNGVEKGRMTGAVKWQGESDARMLSKLTSP